MLQLFNFADILTGKHLAPAVIKEYLWEGSTTVVYTVVWRNPVV